MKSIEQHIAPFVESLFPEFYLTEGEDFVLFSKAYYEWLESNFQYMEMETVSGFSVGDVVTQTQNTGVIASGIIYDIENSFILVELTSFNPFRCETFCNVLAAVENETGASSKVIEQQKVNPTFHARNLFKYRDIDDTIDTFILFFKEKYLKNIQFNIATNKKLLVKNSLDLYRSKGTERAIDLFFKLVYNKNAEVYYPGDDIFKTSSGDWYVPQYLEITRSDRSNDFVGKTVTGMTSGAEAFVEKFIQRKVTTGYIYVLYISNISGTFIRGEALKTDLVYDDSPKVIGSLNELTVINAGSGYSIGDLVDIEDQYGQFGQARVVNTTTVSGEVDFIFNSGGYGYSVNPQSYLSDKLLTVSGLTTTDSQYFRLFDTFSQKLANLTVSIASSNIFPVGSNVYSYYVNNEIKSTGIILDSDMNPIFDVVVNTASNTTTGLVITSGNTENIRIGDLVVGSTNTSVVNTNIASRVSSIVNSTSFEVNTDIIIANGSASLSLSSTGKVGELFVYMTSGFFEEETIYSESNTSYIIANNVLDKTVSAKLLGFEDFITLEVSNTSGSIAVNDTVWQSNGSANLVEATVIATSVTSGIGSIDVRITSGTVNTDLALYSTSNAICNVTGLNTSIAIQYEREKAVEVTTNTASNSTSLLVFSVGTTSRLQPGDKLLSSSNTSVITDSDAYISSIVNSTSVIIDTDVIISNGTTTVIFQDNTDNNLVSDPLVYGVTTASNTRFIIDSISLGSGAAYHIVNVETSEAVFVNTDLLGGNTVLGVPFMSLPLDAATFGFDRDPSANLSSYIMQALDYSILSIGSLTDVITSNPGVDYNLPPKAVIIEPTISALNLKDYILELQEAPGTFKPGDILTQNTSTSNTVLLTVANAEPFVLGELVYQGANLASSTANGFIYSSNTASKQLQIISILGTFSNSSNVYSFINPVNEVVNSISSISTITNKAKALVTQTILGSNTTTVYAKRLSVPSFIIGSSLKNDSLYEANVITVGEQSTSIPIGLNANVEADVITSEGAVTTLEVINSGFGYPNNSIVTFTGSPIQTQGTARVTVDDYGKGLGYYRDSKGFLSSDKKLFDGDYYQEYSYEIKSSFSLDKYIDIFKKVMHVAGTKVFGSVVAQDYGTVQLTLGDDQEIETSVS